MTHPPEIQTAAKAERSEFVTDLTEITEMTEMEEMGTRGLRCQDKPMHCQNYVAVYDTI